MVSNLLLTACWLMVVSLALFAWVWAIARRAKNRPLDVSEYRISVDRSGDFPIIVLVLQSDEGAASTFRLVPKYAYALSDELLRTVAVASAGTAPPKLVTDTASKRAG